MFDIATHTARALIQKNLRLVGAGSLSVSWFLLCLIVFLWFPAGFLPPGPLGPGPSLDYVFPCLCFCRQKLPCTSHVGSCMCSVRSLTSQTAHLGNLGRRPVWCCGAAGLALAVAIRMGKGVPREGFNVKVRRNRELHRWILVSDSPIECNTSSPPNVDTPLSIWPRSVSVRLQQVSDCLLGDPRGSTKP